MREELIHRIKQYCEMLRSKDIEAKWLAICLIKNDKEIMFYCFEDEACNSFFTEQYAQGPCISIQYYLRHPKLWKEFIPGGKN